MQAAETVPSAPAVLQFPHLCKASAPVTQAELSELIEFKNLRVQLEKRISEIEDGLKARLESGADVETGVHIVTLAESFRRSPSWKTIVQRLAKRLGMDGEAYCSNVLAHTKPTRSVSVEVQ